MHCKHRTVVLPRNANHDEHVAKRQYANQHFGLFAVKYLYTGRIDYVEHPHKYIHLV